MAPVFELLDHVADGVYYVDRNRRITYWNKAAERITGFNAEEVQGSCCADGILTHVNENGASLCRGMCPLAATLKDGEPRESLVYLHHKNGHRVPVQVSVSAVRDSTGSIVGAVETFRECSDVIAMRSAIERLKGWNCLDVQSGLLSRRMGEHELEKRVQELQRFGWFFGVLLIEIDFVKDLQQRWGEAAFGDLIRMAALSVQNALRTLDTVARWDQSTFLAVVANAGIEELPGIAQRVRAMVDASYRVTPEGEMHLTVSIGAVAAGGDDSSASLLRKAERATYESRLAGRNRVTVYGAKSPH